MQDTPISSGSYLQMQYLASYRRNEGIAWNWELFFFSLFRCTIFKCEGVCGGITRLYFVVDKEGGREEDKLQGDLYEIK